MVQSSNQDVFGTGARRDSEGSKPLIASIDAGFLSALINRAYNVQFYAAGAAPRGEAYQSAMVHVRFVQSQLAKLQTYDLISFDAIDDDIDDSIVPMSNACLDAALFVLFNEWPPGYPIGLTQPVLNPEMLWRFGDWLAMGAEHYGDNNWRLGMPASRVLSSLLRHVVQWGKDIPVLQFTSPVVVTDASDFPVELLSVPGDGNGDDHAAAVLFNTMVLWVYMTEYLNGDDDRVELFFN